ncbi:CSC1-like protein at4g02900 [Phtheirospermum japonicum]|uniref:CSC1-like protein at4g02900 n=1 Tax=Phtheirospermum japonicum TaxID=374723 RepID=A0A830BA94_9LAMI|nr:CSC1-like protein at4g02900 [Phtheirospermum japonicum]
MLESVVKTVARQRLSAMAKDGGSGVISDNIIDGCSDDLQGCADDRASSSSISFLLNRELRDHSKGGFDIQGSRTGHRTLFNKWHALAVRSQVGHLQGQIRNSIFQNLFSRSTIVRLFDVNKHALQTDALSTAVSAEINAAPVNSHSAAGKKSKLGFSHHLPPNLIDRRRFFQLYDTFLLLAPPQKLQEIDGRTEIREKGFVVLISLLKLLLPINDRVYFAKWYKEGKRSSPKSSGTSLKKFVNLDFWNYLMFWNWMPEALRMPERELVDYAGLDSVAFIRIYLLGLKIFVPIAILAFVVLVPVNLTGETLESITNLTYSDIDKLSISNVPSGSIRLLAHIIMAYVVTFWTCYVLFKEYKLIANKRLLFIASEKRRPDQYTVLVRNIPPDTDETVSQHVEHFFCVNHPEHYLTHKVVYNANRLSRIVMKKKRLRSWLTYYETQLERNATKRPRMKRGCWGIFGKRVDAVNHYKAQLERIIKEEDIEREKVIKDPNAIVPTAFVSFKSRWGAAVCAQTQQSYDPTEWLTEWAPEPRDIYWDNLSISYVQLSINKLIIIVAMFFLTFFFMIPIAFVQSLASIDGMQQVLVFLRPLFKKKRVKAVVQGYLPGIALKLFTSCLPIILMTMSKLEGHISRSLLDKRTAGKFHFFVLVNVFFGSIITGAAFQQLNKFLHQAPSEIPKTVGVAMPMKATFFITYIMVDDWEKELAMEPGCLDFATTEPQIQLYFLLGLVYSVVTPLILPFIIVFFAFSFVIYRHQKYESGASFWPDVHRRVIIGLVLSQILLMGLLSTMNALKSTPLLLVLTVLTIWFHRYCKDRFEPAFKKFPIREAMMKDTIERTKEQKLDLKAYLHNAYVHPAMKDTEIERPKAVEDEENNPLVSRGGSDRSSLSSSSSFTTEAVEELLSYLTPSHTS